MHLKEFHSIDHFSVENFSSTPEKGSNDNNEK